MSRHHALRRLLQGAVEVDAGGAGDRAKAVPIDRDMVGVVERLGLLGPGGGQVEADKEEDQRVGDPVLLRVAVVEGQLAGVIGKAETTVEGLGQVVGALDVQSNQPNAFGDEDLNVLTTLAAQISVALDNARLFQSSQRRAQDMGFLFNVTSAAANPDLSLIESVGTVARMVRVWRRGG